MTANIIVVSTLDSTVLFHFYYYYAVLELSHFLPAFFELVLVLLLIYFTLGFIILWSSTLT